MTKPFTISMPNQTVADLAYLHKTANHPHGEAIATALSLVAETLAFEAKGYSTTIHCTFTPSVDFSVNTRITHRYYHAEEKKKFDKANAYDFHGSLCVFPLTGRMAQDLATIKTALKTNDNSAIAYAVSFTAARVREMRDIPHGRNRICTMREDHLKHKFIKTPYDKTLVNFFAKHARRAATKTARLARQINAPKP